MKRMWVAFAAIVFVGAGAVVPVSASAVGGAELFAAHPSIQAQPTYGKYIQDIAVKGGRLYLGYGDYQNNTGPIDVATVDLTTGATGVEVTAPTEQIDTYRSFHGNLFAPWIDPKGCGTCTPVSGGMSNDVGGWHNDHTFQAAHVYDYTELGSSRFLVGAGAGANVWQSDNGGPWRQAIAEVSPGGSTGWERFYWTVTLGGKVYAQATHKGYETGCGCSASEPFRLRIWDGSSWRAKKSVAINVRQGSDIEVFKDRAYFFQSVFNGTRVSMSGAPFSPVDWFNTGTYLYGIAYDGRLTRTSDGATWESLGTVAVPAQVWSVAVVGGSVYVGTSDGFVYRAAL